MANTESDPKTPTKTKTFQPFELLIAILLGTGAIGGAWSAYQSASLSGEASALRASAVAKGSDATQASNSGTAHLARDALYTVAGFDAITQALASSDPTHRARMLSVADYYYTVQLSDEAYAEMGFPAQFQQTQDNPRPPPLPEDVMLERAQYKWNTRVYGRKLFKDHSEFLWLMDADFRHAELADEWSTRYAAAGLVFTLVVFIAGLGLVFKTAVRWVFGALAVLVWLGSIGHLVVVTLGPPADASPALRPAPGSPPHRIELAGTIASSSSPSLRVGEACRVSLAMDETCQAQVTCGSAVLYGGPAGGGYFRCSRSRDEVSGTDASVTEIDGDPALEVETQASRVRVWESSRGQGLDFDLTIALVH